MARVEMVMPKLGESIIEATIISWTKNVGDPIEAEETVLEIATDKVDSEVPSPTGGILAELLFKNGDVVPVGTVIAYIETEAVGTAPAPVAAPAKPEPVTVATVTAPAVEKVVAIQENVAVVNPHLTGLLLAQPVAGRFYSPLVLNIAREEKIGMDELDRIPGTGMEGRVTKKDILDYVDQRKAAGGSAPSFQQPTVSAPVAPAVSTVTAPPNVPKGTPATGYTSSNGNGESHTSVGSMPKKSFTFNGEVEIMEMDRMRKMIAENMVYSKYTAPHVTSFVKADVTPMVQWREKIKKAFEKQYGQKLTFTPIFIEVVAKVLRELPLLNSSLDGDKIILKKDINIGVAVALPSGNLIVPVIRQADRLNLAGLAAAVNDLTNRARNNKLKPDDLADGTYTLSNVGTFGNLMGTPIILQPQVGVLATGAVRKEPAVIETPTGDMIAIRNMMFLSHSYDHRIIDGALGGQFVRRVGDLLENWDMNREG